MSFYNDVQKEINKSTDNYMITENGAVVYSSVGNAMVDFEFAINSLRNAPEQEIYDKIQKAYAENPELTTKMIFQIGDIREGKGERHIFNSCIKFLETEHPKILKELLPLIPEYTRWDYAIRLATSKNQDIATATRKMIVNQIKEDRQLLSENKPISLCAKWMPSIQSKKPEDRKLALKLEKALGLNHKGYRKLLSELRDRLNIIEKKLSLKQEITREDLSKMSSKALLKYSEGMSQDETFQEFMEGVAEGKETINTAVLTPADIVHKYTTQAGWTVQVKPYDLATENMWNNLKDTIKEQAASTIVIRDGSGSMEERVNSQSSVTCLEVATALSIYCAEKMPEGLKDKFITFSRNPELIDMSKLDTLHDKLQLCYRYNDCSNTDLKKTFDLLLNTLKNNHISQEDAPKNLLILSDMEFDSCYQGCSYNKTDMHNQLKPLFSQIREEWEAEGYKIPTLVFWQLNVNRSPIPEIDNDLGIVYVSGYTTENLDLVLSGELAKFTPEQQLEIILSNERYNAIGEAFNIGLENERNSAKHSVGKNDVIDMQDLQSKLSPPERTPSFYDFYR